MKPRIVYVKRTRNTKSTETKTFIAGSHVVPSLTHSLPSPCSPLFSPLCCPFSASFFPQPFSNATPFMLLPFQLSLFPSFVLFPSNFLTVHLQISSPNIPLFHAFLLFSFSCSFPPCPSILHRLAFFSLLPPSPLFVLSLQSPHSLPIHIIHLPRLVLSTSSSSLTLVLPFLLSLPSFLYPFFLFICFSSPSLPQPPITLSPSSACASFPPAQPPSLTVT